jgi:hypothetical protein
MDTSKTNDNTICTFSNKVLHPELVNLKDIGDDLEIDPNKLYKHVVKNNLKSLCEKIYSAK